MADERRTDAEARPPGPALGALPPRSPPASRAGVGPSCVAMRPGPRQSIFQFLVARFPRVASDEWLARLQAGDVIDDRGRAVAADEPCRPDGKLYYFRSIPNEPVLPFDETLLYRDEHIAVVDKPHGLAVLPAGRHVRETLLTRVRQRLGVDAATPVHRIDRDTAGLVMFSLQAASRDAYHALFRDRRIGKYYEAIAPFDSRLAFPMLRRSRIRESAEAFMQMCEVPGEPNSATEIDLLAVDRSGRQELGRYALRPLTGLRHQLRVHLAALGLPIVNDRIYPVLQSDAAGNAAALALHQLAPLQLLAKRLTFVDPLCGARREFESPRTLEFATALGQEDHLPASV